MLLVSNNWNRDTARPIVSFTSIFFSLIVRRVKGTAVSCVAELGNRMLENAKRKPTISPEDRLSVVLKEMLNDGLGLMSPNPANFIKVLAVTSVPAVMSS